MELKDVVGVGQAGLSAVLDEVSKLRDPQADEPAAEQLAEEAEPTQGGSVHAGEDTPSESGVEVRQLMASMATLAAPAMVRAVPGVARRGGKGLMVLALVGAAAGAGYLVWKRRQAAVDAELSGESPYVARASGAGEAAFERGAADVDSPDVVDPEFAREIDEAADELAGDIVDSIEVPDAAADEADDEIAEEFVEGIQESGR